MENWKDDIGESETMVVEVNSNENGYDELGESYVSFYIKLRWAPPQNKLYKRKLNCSFMRSSKHLAYSKDYNSLSNAKTNRIETLTSRLPEHFIQPFMLLRYGGSCGGPSAGVWVFRVFSIPLPDGRAGSGVWTD